SVMIYLATDDEVYTRNCIEQMLTAGKRVIVPYCYDGVCRLGVAEISDMKKDLVTGKYGIEEPHETIRKNFLKSDIDLVVCPGVSFDRYGARLGRGKGYYDSFLEELKGRVPLIGLAYECQISSDPLPFDYHDIAVDQIITEDGPIISIPS
ncbi:MAG: 5-formyltetrahydrofolate cyclo-ligase, partial [Chitinispirillaceae bacterium]